MRKKSSFFCGIAAFLFLQSSAWADAPRAQKFVAEAKAEVESRAYERAVKKLELAEAELEGLSAEEKKPVQAAIAEVRSLIASAKAATDKPMYLRQLQRVMTDAEEAVGNLATWPGAQLRAEEFFKKPEPRAALGKELEDAQKQYATFQALHMKKAIVVYREYATNSVVGLEKIWSEKKGKVADTQNANTRDTAIVDMERAIKSTKAQLALLPADDETRKELTPRVASIESAINTAGNAGEIAEVLRRLKDSWDLDTRECGGWEKENADVTFARYCKEQNDTVSAFGAPKTANFLRVAKQWLKNRETDKAYQRVAAATEVKTFVDGKTAAVAEATAKIDGAASSIVAAAEKTPITDNNLNAFQKLQGDLRVNFNDVAKSDPYTKRIADLIANRNQAIAGESKARDEWYANSTAQASAKWPEMKAKFAASTGFDPLNPGKTGQLYVVTTHNLMGYRYQPGSFPFALTINGHAIAAKYDPTVAGAVEEVQKKLGRDLGDNDDDGQWEVVFRVENSKAKLMARRQVDGDVRVNGKKVGTYREEYDEPVEAVIVTIVAARCGPLAVAAGVGMVTETGETKTVSSSDPLLTGKTGFTGYGTIGSILRLFVAFGAAFSALVLAGFAPFKSLLPLASKLAIPFGIVGGITVLAGFIWLIASSFRGFGAAFVLIATGGFIVAMTLEKLGIIKPDLAGKIRLIGVPLGFGCAAVVLLSVILQGRIWVM